MIESKQFILNKLDVVNFMSIETLTNQKLSSRCYSFKTKESVLPALESIQSAMASAGDLEQAKKIDQLKLKWQKEELALTFCGHFSAGKSSLINELLGEELLPASPIPTSANVVQIKSGEPYARVHSHTGKTLDFEFTDSLTELRDYCRNGADVESIELSYPLAWPSSLVLMDTPGIDSTDEAHHLATESALHLADILLYTMDYNHVLSELNLQFTKLMQDQGKSIVLIVNMIDKHQAFEISFEAYRTSVEEAFAAWQIRPAGIFYTSLKDKNHPHNQLEALKQQMRQWVADRQTIRENSLVQSVLHLIDTHAKWLRSEQQDEREALEAILGENAEDSAAQAEKLQADIRYLEQTAQNLEAKGKKEFNSITENANLTPYAIRDLAKLYLESRKPGFKVGLLFSAAKTQVEKDKRLEQFRHSYAEQVSSQLLWHMKEAIIRLHEKAGTATDEILADIHRWHPPIEASFLEKLVHEGSLPTLSGEYVLNYCQEVSSATKALYRREALELLDEAVAIADKAAKGNIEQLWDASSQLKQLIDAQNRLQELDARWLNEKQRLSNLWLAPAEISEGKGLTAISETKDKTERNDSKPPALNRFQVAWDEIETNANNEAEHSYANSARAALVAAAQQLRLAAGQITDVTGLRNAANAMHVRADRLEQNRFTVALFGAFSAGKSSFANALMGHRVLPVSPNPTTATINKIMPPDEHHPHGTVIVKLKNVEDLLAELQASLRLFEKEALTLEAALDQIAQIQPLDWNPSSKPHYHFLQAVKKGFATIGNHLGQQQSVNAEGFQAYVAEEDKAAFVEMIELYYACPLTLQGITLVDTPGADSINARHTGVAFEYIKNADAVLFVTYYNHAFSNADRDFLLQLGRVKDTFEMDKMFFIINAADLAHSEEELQSVKRHIADSLETHGIRHPRIYPVSSQQALQSKLGAKGKLSPEEEASVRKKLPAASLSHSWSSLGEHSGLPAFEKDFFSFTIDELTQVAIAASLAEIERSRKQLNEMISAAQEDASIRSERLKQAKLRLQQSRGLQIDSASEHKSIEKEVEELFFYVKKRCFDRFGETFQQSFNPSVLQDDGRDIKKVLRASLDELIHQLAHDLAQEGRATSLRMEKFLKSRFKRLFDKWTAAMSPYTLDFEYAELADEEWETPEFSKGLPTADKASLTSALSLYKNARHFFENNGKLAMREKLEKALQPIVANYIEVVMDQFKRFYLKTYEERSQAMEKDVKEQSTAYFDGLMSSLSEQPNTALWKPIAVQLETVCDEMKRSISLR